MNELLDDNDEDRTAILQRRMRFVLSALGAVTAATLAQACACLSPLVDADLMTDANQAVSDAADASNDASVDGR